MVGSMTGTDTAEGCGNGRVMFGNGRVVFGVAGRMPDRVVGCAFEGVLEGIVGIVLLVSDRSYGAEGSPCSSLGSGIDIGPAREAISFARFLS